MEGTKRDNITIFLTIEGIIYVLVQNLPFCRQFIFCPLLLRYESKPIVGDRT